MVENYPIHDYYGSTPLLLALDNKNSDLFGYLLTKTVYLPYLIDVFRYIIKEGDIETLKYIFNLVTLDTLKEYNCLNESLHYASLYGKLNIVYYIINLGGEVTSNDNAAIVGAARNGHIDVLKYLVFRGGHLSDISVWFATRGGHMNILTYANSQGFDLMYDGCTLLTAASLGGHVDVFEYLLEKGLKIGDQEDELVINAIHSHNIDFFIHLVKNYVPIFKDIDAILEAAAGMGVLTLLQFIVAKYIKDYVIMVHNNHLDALLSTRIDKDTLIQRLLIAATANDHEHVLEYFIAQSVDIKPYEDILLRVAAEEGNIRTLKFLLNNGLNITPKNNGGFLYAVIEDQISTVNFLLSMGANLHAENDKAFIIAAEDSNVRMMRLLIDKGVDIYNIDFSSSSVSLMDVKTLLSIE
jgi:ankyrin repeat protein